MIKHAYRAVSISRLKQEIRDIKVSIERLNEMETTPLTLTKRIQALEAMRLGKEAFPTLMPD
jgi:hypothetical protein